MLKHDLGSTTENKEGEKKNWPEHGCGVCGYTSRLPPFPSTTGASCLSLFVCYFHPPYGASGSRGTLAEPRESPWPPSGLREPPACSPGLSRLPSPETSAGAFLPPRPFVPAVRCPQRGCHRRLPGTLTLPAASAALGTGMEIQNQTPRRPQGDHPIPSYPNPSRPISSHSSRPALEWGRERRVVSRGISVGISLRGAPVPLLRAGPSKVETAPRGSLCKSFKNRWRRRVCLKSGCGSTPGHFRLSSTPRYQSPGACDK